MVLPVIVLPQQFLTCIAKDVFFPSNWRNPTAGGARLPTKTSPQLPPPAPELPPESYEKSSSLVPLASPWRSPHFSLTACTFRRVLLSTSGKLEQSIAGNYLYFLNRTNTSSFLLLFGHFSRDFVAVSNLSHQHVPNMNDTQIGKLPSGHHLRGDRSQVAIN